MSARVVIHPRVGARSGWMLAQTLGWRIDYYWMRRWSGFLRVLVR